MVEEIEPRQPDLTPEINLLKGLAGPRSAAVIQYVQDRYRMRWRKFADGVHTDSGLNPEELGGRIITDERLGDLFLAGAETSTRTSDEAHIRLLARVIAEAFTDEAKINESEVRLQTLRQVTSQEIRALAVLARRDEERGIDEKGFQQAGFRIEAPAGSRETGATHCKCGAPFNWQDTWRLLFRHARRSPCAVQGAGAWRYYLVRSCKLDLFSADETCRWA